MPTKKKAKAKQTDELQPKFVRITPGMLHEAYEAAKADESKQDAALDLFKQYMGIFKQNGVTPAPKLQKLYDELKEQRQ